MVESSETSVTGHNEVLAFCSDLGRLMLKYGAEVSNVKYHMAEIANHYGEKYCEILALGNGIITSESPKASKTRDKFLRIDLYHLKTPRLQYIVSITELCQQIVNKNLPLEEAKKELEKIRKIKTKPIWEQLIGAILICAGFAVIYGGGWNDILAACITGLLTKLYILYVGRRFSTVVNTATSAVVGATLCILLVMAGLGNNVSRLIVCTISLMVPGVQLINGIRDVLKLDYLSGITQLVHVMLIFVCMIIGANIAQYLIAPLVINSNIMEEFENFAPYSFPMWGKALAAYITATGFAISFSIPKKMYIIVAMIALLGYCLRMGISMNLAEFAPEIASSNGYSDWIGMFPAAFIVTFLSTIMTRRYKCPVVVLLVCAIVLMNPSAKLFWTIFYYLGENIKTSILNWYDASIALMHIITGMVLGMEIPLLFLRKNIKIQ